MNPASIDNPKPRNFPINLKNNKYLDRIDQYEFNKNLITFCFFTAAESHHVLASPLPWPTPQRLVKMQQRLERPSAVPPTTITTIHSAAAARLAGRRPPAVIRAASCSQPRHRRTPAEFTFYCGSRLTKTMSCRLTECQPGQRPG